MTGILTLAALLAAAGVLVWRLNARPAEHNTVTGRRL